MILPIKRTDLDGLIVFLAAAELGGFRAAARQLGVTPSAISQSIRTLERKVGAPLFFRTTRNIGLTEAGEQLLLYAKPAVEMLSLGLDAARGLGGEVSGRLRITAPRASLPLIANRLFPELFEQFPNVQLELIGEDRLIDIIEEGFDAGIRLGQTVRSDMTAVRLTEAVRFAVIAAPSFLARCGRPRIPDELRNFPCIQLRRTPNVSYQWDFVIADQITRLSVEGPLIVNDVEMSIRAALRGVGLAHMPVSLVMNYIAKGELETVLDEYVTEVPGLMLYYPSRSQSLPKLRAFADFARSRLRAPFHPDDYLPTTTA